MRVDLASKAKGTGCSAPGQKAESEDLEGRRSGESTSMSNTCTKAGTVTIPSLSKGVEDREHLQMTRSGHQPVDYLSQERCRLVISHDLVT